MKVPVNAASALKTQVGVLERDGFGARLLDEDDVAWFVNRSEPLDYIGDKAKLKDIIEARVTPAGSEYSEQVELAWDVVTFSEKRLVI